MRDARTCPCGQLYRVVSLKWRKKSGDWVRAKECQCGNKIKTVEAVIEAGKKHRSIAQREDGRRTGHDRLGAQDIGRAGKVPQDIG